MKMKDLFPISTVNSMGVDEGVPAWGCQMCHMFRKTCKTSVSSAAAEHKAHNHPSCQRVRHETSTHV